MHLLSTKYTNIFSNRKNIFRVTLELSKGMTNDKIRDKIDLAYHDIA